jgi:peptide deformylase
MAIRNILRDEDPSLKKTSRAVADFDKRLHQLLDDMRETLIEANGLGLAAPQVGVLRRVALIVDLNIETDLLEEQIIELVNPKITASSGTQSGSEGCLSIPGIYGIVTRPDLVKVKAQDRNGKPFEIWCKDITARAACHEVDHLDGVLFTAHVERFLTEEELAALNAEDDEESTQ